MHALTLERTSICQLLIEYGADPNIEDRNGRCPLSVAIGRGNEDIFDLILAAGGRLKEKHYVSYIFVRKKFFCTV